jgi:hypothetical protein
LIIVGMHDSRVRAIQDTLPRGIPRPGYHLGRVYSRDMDVDIDDSYIYRVQPVIEDAEHANAGTPESARNGTLMRHQATERAGA